MALLDPEAHATAERSRRGLVFLVVALVGLGAAGWLAFRLSRPARPQPRAAAPTARPTAGTATGAVDVTADVDRASVFIDGKLIGPAPQRASGLSPGRHMVRVEASGRVPYELEVHVVPGQTTRVAARLRAPGGATAPAAPAAAGDELHVDSDVPGAQVFVDHQLRGRTPLVLRDLTPGSHRVNVTADGDEMQAQDVTVEGPTRVRVSFKEVRLDETLDVVHKHALGSCEGRLQATPRGLRYVPAKGDHAFDVPLASLQTFEVDYLKKELRVKAGGRSYTFTTRRGSADPLLSFQQKVSAARARLG